MENLENILVQISKNTNKIYSLLNKQCVILEKQNRLFLEMYVSNYSKYKELSDEVQNLSETVDKHNSKIFALEFYKEQLVSK